MRSLWSEDVGKTDDELQSPVSIIRAQAKLLGRQTQMMVEAEVEDDVEYHYDYEADERFVVPRDEFKYNFYRRKQ